MMKRSTLLGMFQRISRIQTHRSNLRTQWFTSDASTTRLSKLVATRAGLSRSQAEKQIRQGLVTVNGTIIDTPFSMVDTKAAIKSQGKLLLHKERPAQVWLVHKLAGELVSDVDDKNRPLIWDRLTQFRGCKAVGRLDFHTEGLLVVTNDGLYKRTLELSDLHRVYRVRVHGTANQVEAVGRWVPRGVRLRDQTWLDPMRVRVERKRQNSTNHWLQVTCTQGKNRQVRRVMEHFGLRVTRLIRTHFGDYQLQTIPPGMALPVPLKPVESQRRQGSLKRRVVRSKSSAAVQRVKANEISSW